MAEAWDDMGIDARRKYYAKLRHVCGYTGANRAGFNPAKCEKCRMRHADVLDEGLHESYGIGRKPSLDDYDGN